MSSSLAATIGGHDARLTSLDRVRAEMQERFHLYEEIRALSEADQDDLFKLLWEAQTGHPEALEAIYSLVYDEIPIGMEEFVLSKQYLALKGLINPEKLDLLVRFDQPHVRKFFCAAGSGSGKALALDTPLPTPTGWTTMGDVRVGEALLDERNRPCRVVAKSHEENRLCWELWFEGCCIVASDRHQWPVSANGTMSTEALAHVRLPRVLGPGGREARTGILTHTVAVGSRLVQCVEVDSPSHLYLAGSARIPTHNSFMVSIAKARQIYRLLCLRRPDLFYMLGPGSRIAAINLSVSKDQARDVIFAEFLARVNGSPWFQKQGFKALQSRARFPKDVYAMSGGSSATSYYGYHTIFGSLDEASFMLDGERSIAEELAEALLKSLNTRFPRAFKLFVISTLRSTDDFLMTKIDQIREDGVRVL